MRKYTVTGMSCAACAARIEKAVGALAGVESCTVSLLTNTLAVEGAAAPEAVMKAVRDAGYAAAPQDAPASGQPAAAPAAADPLQDTQTPALCRRLAISVVLWLALMYVSMGHMMWGWPLPAALAADHVGQGLLQLLLSAAIMVVNQRFFQSGFKSLWHRAPNMDALVALGAGAAFGWSTWVLFTMSAAAAAGDHAAVMQGMDGLYFESAGTILTLITLGKMLEARAKGRTTDALKSLMKLTPQTATVLRGDTEVTLPVEQVRVGDIFAVRPGESIPVDGEVLEGISAVNEAALTGESIPVDKAQGADVWAATVNLSGYLRCRATRVGQDTTLAQVIRMVGDAAATKAPIAKVADKVSGVFVPVVMALALLTTAVWLALGQGVGWALARGISVLVISCPCALGLATPVAIMVGSGVGAKSGMLFKTAVSLESAGRTQIVALDKTGTVTTGRPQVTDLVPAPGVTRQELLAKAAALEAKSEHPLAAAVLAAATEQGIRPADTQRFEALPGHGLRALCGDEPLVGGSVAFISQQAAVPPKMLEEAQRLADEGKTPLLFCAGAQVLGLIAVADVIKPDAREAVRQLRDMGIRVVMLTGDDRRTARAIGAQAGVDEVIAEVLPQGKESTVRALQQQGRVAMVGDGINDAPALTRADVGIAIGAGADVAIDAADIVLVKSRLADVPAAIRLGRATLRNIHENLFWAFIYNIIGIPLAAGVWIPLFNWQLDPMFGAAAMSLSSFCVVSNALRLNLFPRWEARRRRRARGDGEAQPDVAVRTAAAQEPAAVAAEDTAAKPTPAVAQAPADTAAAAAQEPLQTATLEIEGMMCAHCEAHITQALLAVEGVREAQASHEKGRAVVRLAPQVTDEALRAAIEGADYTLKAVHRA